MLRRARHACLGSLLILLVATSFLASCTRRKNDESQSARDTASRRPERPVATTPSPAAAATATYRGIYDNPVTLCNGRWEGEPVAPDAVSRPTVELARDFQLIGDMNGDGSDEAVVLLVENSGGSGVFSYLAVLGRGDRTLENLGTALVGDRVQIRSFRMEGGRVVLDVVQQGSEDAMCCPTEKATRQWTLGDKGLTEGEVQVTGKSSLADLAGAEWVLTHLGWDDPAPAEPSITLVFEDARIGGQGACNSYFASMEPEGSSDSFRLGPIGATKKMCPHDVMALENVYFARLGAARSWSYITGKLAIIWMKDSESGILFFARR